MEYHIWFVFCLIVYAVSGIKSVDFLIALLFAIVIMMALDIRKLLSQILSQLRENSWDKS